MKFNNGKCKVLHQGRKNPWQQGRLGPDCLGSRSAEKVMGALVGSKLNVSQCEPGSKGADSILGCTDKSVARRSGKCLVAFDSTLDRPHLKYFIQACAS